MTDTALAGAIDQIRGASGAASPPVTAFFDPTSFTVSYVVHDPATRRAAIIDSVLGFDPASGQVSTSALDDIVAHVRTNDLVVDWVLETHAHADHLSAAHHLQQKLGGQTGIGRQITEVRQHFGEVFNGGARSAREDAEFDRLFDDGDVFAIGEIPITALHVPGHTPADLAYVFGDVVFAGDTLFMPDSGTARADFPGGDARRLFRSIRRLLALPVETRLFLCHDYKAPGRDRYVWETTVLEERQTNIHVRDGIDEDSFVAMRTARDATLSVPRLLLSSIQVNIRGGKFPPAEANGVHYLKIPVSGL